MRRFPGHFLLALLVLTACGCDDSAPGGLLPGPSVSSSDGQLSLEMLAVRPAYQVVEGVGTTLDMKLHAWWNDQSDGEIEGEAWTSEDEGVATVDDVGHVTAVTAGETLIHAVFQGQDAVARVVVRMPPALPDQAPQPSNSATDTSGDRSPPPPDPQPHVTGPQEAPPPSPSAPYADRVVSYHVGSGGGFHEDQLPVIVLGPPKGAGAFMGSFDVFSLGVGGEIVLEWTDYFAFNGTGVDFTVFENAFQIGSDPSNTFAEPGIVGVSNDGVNFVEFPCDALNKPYRGCAGVHPTFANPDTNTINPADPSVSGGDSFDLADVGFTTARFVRIRDAGVANGPIGPGTAGFDLDAVAIVHGTLPY